MAIENGFTGRDNSRLPHIIGMGPSSGGVGKSANGKVIASLAYAAGLRVLLIDADPGLGSLSKTLRPEHYTVLQFPRTHEELGQLVPFFMENTVGHDVVIVDLGANFMSTAAISMPFRAAMRELKRLGWRTSIAVSTMPGKDGLLEDAPNFAAQLAAVAQPYIICRGWQMDRLPEEMRLLTETYPWWSMPQMEVAALTDMADRGLLPIDYARLKPPQFTRAAAMVAYTLVNLAAQPVVHQLLGSVPDHAMLVDLSTDCPSWRYPNKIARWQICDAVLEAEVEYLHAEHSLRELSEQATDAQLRDAHRKWKLRHQTMIAASQAARVDHD